MTHAELEAKVAELEARMQRRDRALARVLAEMDREADTAVAPEKPPKPDLEGASASADEMLREIRLRRRKG
jgi:hypothetical protein